MLFNSYQFLFVFFPTVFIVLMFMARYGEKAQIIVLLGASLLFYSLWDVRFLVLLGGSILTNYGLSRPLRWSVERGRSRHANLLLAAGVTFNLTVLGIFKYMQFIIYNMNTIAGTSFVLYTVILPLGISFFTFEQIGFLVDIRRGHLYRADLLRYALFVSFFPRLVAGPILRYGEILPQLSGKTRWRPAPDLAVGLTLFFMGLAKKSLLADGIAPCVAPVFAAAQAGQQIDLFMAWGGALAYTCQLYFDFSGYSDMAIGLARCFGIRFPGNFSSPYKACSIIEFWRRWHMTLSRFLRDYLYISLGGNRCGPARRYANLMVTMLLGGLWHGANWTFLFWGGLHGGYLAVNHGWLALSGRSRPLAAFGSSRAGAMLGFVLTFVAIVVAWVFFRAPTFGAAAQVLAGMAGAHGAALPLGLAYALSPIHGLLQTVGIRFVEGSGTTLVQTWLWVAALLALATLAPNTQELLGPWEPVLESPRLEVPAGPRPSLAARWTWRPTPAWAVVTGVLAFLGVISITRVSEFLYWQF